MVNILSESRVRENRRHGSTRGFKFINLEIYYEKKKNNNRILLIIFLVLLLLTIGLGVVYYFVFYNQDESKIFGDNSKEIKSSKQKEEKEDDSSQYDGKVLKITSTDDKINGRAYLTYNEEKNNIKVEFNAFLNDNLVRNGTCGEPMDGKSSGCGKMIRYEYVQKTISQKNSDKNYGVYLVPVLCNKNQLLEKDKLGDFGKFYGTETCGLDYQVGAETPTFLIRGKIEFSFYHEILGLYSVVIYNPSLFWKIVDGSDGDFILDSDRALKEGEKVKDYVIEFGE